MIDALILIYFTGVGFFLCGALMLHEWDGIFVAFLWPIILPLSFFVR